MESVAQVGVRMAHFQLGSFLIGLVSNWVHYNCFPSKWFAELEMTSGKTTPGWPHWRRIGNEPCVMATARENRGAGAAQSQHKMLWCGISWYDIGHVGVSTLCICPAWPKHQTCAMTGWHYLSNATCLIRPRLFYVLFVVSRIALICYIIRYFWRNCVRQVVSDKWLTLTWGSNFWAPPWRQKLHPGGASLGFKDCPYTGVASISTTYVSK